MDGLKPILMVHILLGIFYFLAEMNFILLSENKMRASDLISRILFHKTGFKSISARKKKFFKLYIPRGLVSRYEPNLEPR